ncbi:SseB family protein [Streptomyces sp. BE133]|uniref:SseB family protein n=1 Tax=Streptomyces sp. BE133 TaxID=3002523 RepID=UPI002E7AA4C0|nr:SseB family protein [Streptomyces sp. BE133]MEE1808463.1 SseB family protein [Streptomyces sp. BE133]
MFDNGDDIAEPPVRRSKIADLADWPAPEVPTAPHEALDPVPAMTPEDDPVAAARHEFAVLLGEFRRSAVLVPLDEAGDLWSAEQNGVRWICAFSDEEALARFARARGDAGREWTYQAVLGARLLDVMVPLLPGPAGVALDAGSEDGMLFPPVAGIVPDAVAVDLGGMQ